MPAGTDSKRVKSIEDALSWAYQQGYVFARQAADDYTRLADCAFALEDLGAYGYALQFFDTTEEAERAIASTSWGKYRKPD